MPLNASRGAINIPITPIGGKTLLISWIRQEQTQWCWAACMQMVINSSETGGIQQCELANAAFSLTGCCGAPSSSLCNNPLGIYHIEPEWIRFGYDAPYENSSLEFSRIQFEIDRNRIVELGLKWRGGGGHAVLIIGWDVVDSIEMVIVLDPWRGQLNIPYTDMVSAYGEGQWKWSWGGIKRG